MNPLLGMPAPQAVPEPCSAPDSGDQLESLLRQVQAVLREGCGSDAFAKCAALEDGVRAALEVITSEQQALRPRRGVC